MRKKTKTDQTGVRFDLELLELLKIKGYASTPQQAINFYEGYFKANFLKQEVYTTDFKPVLDTIIEKEGICTGNKVKSKPCDTAAPQIKSIGEPVRGEKESKWDFRIRWQEWKDKLPPG